MVPLRREAARLVLETGGEGEPTPHSVRLVIGDQHLLSRLHAAAAAGGDPLQPVLRVEVGRGDDTLPPIAGRHALTEDGLRFTPLFPFVAGLAFRATFDPRPLGADKPEEGLTITFAGLAAPLAEAPVVERIYPSADELPENLLRFYVRFSQPMQRGRVGTEFALLGQDGRPLYDALYRAPVELWDREMRCLTILLDPGRLKRMVGPHRALGPPLRAGEFYALSIGAGMIGASGRSLPRTVLKRFRATAPMRTPLSATPWQLVPPRVASRERLLVRFGRTMDWALLQQAITVTTIDGRSVAGCVDACLLEKEAVFTPAEPWSPAPHILRASPQLEDVCGNDFADAFDKSLEPGTPMKTAVPFVGCFSPFLGARHDNRAGYAAHGRPCTRINDP